ncbi:uncharacterized protein KY384_007150 [Bacidia gigantensis]|uniref:uncharacterized protein n=1 Tax=Bacidia gigantensis TaxID=2732470 RepID=UPI001D05BA7C|nr:uncharacterized protein KY384_007150 [Bacidia gigantensis]KAG8528233.1 hypothetical protein KY384_007150 [Bacidia gigantensis]
MTGFTLPVLIISLLSATEALIIRQVDPAGSGSSSDGSAAATPVPASTTGNNSQAGSVSLPYQVPGEPFIDYLTRVLGGQSNKWGNAPNLTDGTTVVSRPDLTGRKEKRSSSGFGVFSSVWTSGNDFFNITADFRQCFGLAESSNIGIYTTHLSQTLYGVTWGQVLDDLIQVREVTPTGQDAYAGVIIQNGADGINEAQDLLDDIICENATTVSANPTSDGVRQELRKLLFDEHEARRWTAVILNAILGGIVGFALSAITDEAFEGQLNPKNDVQTTILVAILAICAGVVDFNKDRGNLDPVVQGVQAASGATVRVQHATAHLAATSRARATITSIRGRRTTRPGSRNWRVGLRFVNGRMSANAAASAVISSVLPQATEDSSPNSSDGGAPPSCLNPGEVVVDLSPPNDAGEQQVQAAVTTDFGVEPIAEAEQEIDEFQTPYNCP